MFTAGQRKVRTITVEISIDKGDLVTIVDKDEDMSFREPRLDGRLEDIPGILRVEYYIPVGEHAYILFTVEESFINDVKMWIQVENVVNSYLRSK